MPILQWLPLIAAPLLLASACTVAGAGDLSVPTGDVILTVSGRIENTNVGDTVQFDREMLEALGFVDVTTTTPWHAGKMTFSGVPMEALLREVGAEGETITAVTLNNYQADIPLSDAWEAGVILAMKLNGQDMAVRYKGPIFVVYPYDSWHGYQTQTYYSRSAWHVTQLIIR
ncbi:molybdopterin-dependent oxidoreductase [Falsirhodobacter deserti]|uniref:molybdopterin-dependent oxidoreductase n=1 Tax=Falsirhodobacter deserti TaxID=1365611 RepID=UPI000FE308B9|nr:molybdopterin-dependent oxidoreductase [Falsirhodobacter deserti]